jgi:hypothetical protein
LPLCLLLADTMPDPILLILRYMHILGAITLMGGTIFMRFGLAPVVAGLDEKAKAQLHQQIRARWSKLVMISSGLLLVSGIANMIMYSSRFYTIEPLWGMSYSMIVGIKFLLAIPIFVLASFLGGRTAAAQKIQANAVTWMNVNLVLALLMVLIGGALRFLPKVPVERAPASAATSPAAPELSDLADEKLSFRRTAE